MINLSIDQKIYAISSNSIVNYIISGIYVQGALNQPSILKQGQFQNMNLLYKVVGDTIIESIIVSNPGLSTDITFYINVKTPEGEIFQATLDTNYTLMYDADGWQIYDDLGLLVGGTGGGAGITDGDKGDITVSGVGSIWTIDNGLLATKIADGSVDNTKFQYINTLTSNTQTQLDNISRDMLAFAVAL